jgi:hypothetical protein
VPGIALSRRRFLATCVTILTAPPVAVAQTQLRCARAMPSMGVDEEERE